jgi:hypothetical protein
LAVALIPHRRRHRAAILDDLAIALHDRYQLRGVPGDQDAAVAARHQAADEASADDPRRAGYLNSLREDLPTLYARTSDRRTLPLAVSEHTAVDETGARNRTS